MITPPNQRDWDKFFTEDDATGEIELPRCAGMTVGAISIREANALIRQAIAEAVTVYGEQTVYDGMVYCREVRGKEDTHTAKLIAIKPIGT